MPGFSRSPHLSFSPPLASSPPFCFLWSSSATFERLRGALQSPPKLRSALSFAPGEKHAPPKVCVSLAASLNVLSAQRLRARRRKHFHYALAACKRHNIGFPAPSSRKRKTQEARTIEFAPHSGPREGETRSRRFNWCHFPFGGRSRCLTMCCCPFPVDPTSAHRPRWQQTAPRFEG